MTKHLVFFIWVIAIGALMLIGYYVSFYEGNHYLLDVWESGSPIAFLAITAIAFLIHMQMCIERSKQIMTKKEMRRIKIYAPRKKKKVPEENPGFSSEKAEQPTIVFSEN